MLQFGHFVANIVIFSTKQWFYQIKTFEVVSLLREVILDPPDNEMQVDNFGALFICPMDIISLGNKCCNLNPRDTHFWFMGSIPFGWGYIKKREFTDYYQHTNPHSVFPNGGLYFLDTCAICGER